MMMNNLSRLKIKESIFEKLKKKIMYTLVNEKKI